jgi:hypothetical protein
MAQGIQQADAGMQLGLYESPGRRAGRQTRGRRPASSARLCGACRAKEARYGFRDELADDPLVERPRALCFECFRMEMTRRQAIAARVARGWNGHQVRLPLEERLQALARRRRRAQIAARHALGLQ